MTIAAWVLVLIMLPAACFAYVDPGSTGILFQVLSLIAAVVVGYFIAFRKFLVGLLRKWFGGKGNEPGERK